MSPEPASARNPHQQSPLAPIYGIYAALAQSLPFHPEHGLGGKLIYAGDLAGRGRELLCAANIAGAASLAASADIAVRRQAIRDGVIDFLVTSLEEALRIVKNEIRKRQAVSVGVEVHSHQLVEFMLERGVLPDLLPPLGWPENASGLAESNADRFQREGSRRIFAPNLSDAGFTTWSVERESARWLPKLDACSRAAVPSDDLVRQRWLKLAPRYLGRLAQRQHGVALSAAETVIFRAKSLDLKEKLHEDSGEPISIQINGESL